MHVTSKVNLEFTQVPILTKSSGQQSAISSHIFGEAKVIRGFLSTWGVMPLTPPHIVQGTNVKPIF